jgi:hypothetical protein
LGFFIFIPHSNSLLCWRAVSRRLIALLLYGAAASVCGCASVQGDLQRAQLLYKDARYEETEAWLGELEHDAPGMAPTELTHFYYLKGMTAFRLGQRDEALHSLSLADALAIREPASLPQDWSDVLRRTLSELTPRTASSHARDPAQPDAM